MKSLVSVFLVFAVAISMTSCEKKIANPLSDPEPALKNTVLTMKVKGSVWFEAPIEGNHSNETPPRFMIRHIASPSGIEVGCQYVGKGVVDDYSTDDVYLISLKTGEEKPTEYDLFLYEGGNQVAVVREEIEIAFMQQEADGKPLLTSARYLP